MKFKLSYQKASTVLLSILIIVSVGIIYYAQGIKVIGVRSYFAGPRFYPIVVASLMLIFCIASLIET